MFVCCVRVLRSCVVFVYIGVCMRGLLREVDEKIYCRAKFGVQ